MTLLVSSQWETTVTRNKETKTVYADILWDDDGNRDGLRPDQILVQLYANGQPVGEPTTLTGGQHRQQLADLLDRTGCL